MQKPAKLSLRVLAIAAAAVPAACVSNQDITGSVSERASLAARLQQPVAYRELNPPPSPVEIRAQCWMRYDREEADLDTKSLLVRKCVSDRTGLDIR
jgi:hypothetical protein